MYKMDKKILILIDKVGKKSALLAEITAKHLGYASGVFLASFSDLVFEIGTKNPDVTVGEHSLVDFGLVYFRRAGKYIASAGTVALFLEKLGIRYFDTKFQKIGPAGSKFTLLVELALSSVPILPTIYTSKNNVLDRVEQIISKLGLPMIAKEYDSQRNEGIYIIKNRDDFAKLLLIEKKKGECQFMFQKFINIANEYRMLVLKDRVAVVHTKAIRDYSGFKVVDNTPANNVTFIDAAGLPDDIKNIAVRAAQSLNLEIAGVDICIEKTTGKVYVIEVNRGPGFFTDTNFSPELNIMADFLVSELKS